LYTTTPDVVSEVQVVSGACLMVNADIFRAVGGFSADYFMYAEEVELCYRIRQAGFKVCHIGAAHVVHFGGQSTRKQVSGFADVQMRESVFTLLRKVRGNGYARVYRAALLLSALVRLTALTPLFLAPPRLISREAVRLTFRKWRNIAAWSLDLRKWTPVLRRADPHPASPLENRP
jgi:GT2 family glycosyltransferase